MFLILDSTKIFKNDKEHLIFHFWKLNTSKKNWQFTVRSLTLASQQHIPENDGEIVAGEISESHLILANLEISHTDILKHFIDSQQALWWYGCSYFLLQNTTIRLKATFFSTSHKIQYCFWVDQNTSYERLYSSFFK